MVSIRWNSVSVAGIVSIAAWVERIEELGGWGWEAVAMVQERLDNDSRIIPSSPPSSRLGIASSRKPVPVTQLDTFPLLSLLELS